LDCYEKALAQLEEAESLVDVALNQTRQAQADLDSAKASFEFKYGGEIKVFHSDTCPDGWQEVSATKGFVLVSRPEGAKTGDHKNTPLSKDEVSRVGPHKHDVEITEPPHSHGIDDPGHTHTIDTWGARHSCYDPHDAKDCWQHTATTQTSKSSTGIKVSSATLGVDVKVKATESQGYPLTYVLLCQRIASHNKV